jgi:mannose-6-phosphate isomerase-like protein (cupin superfamily)
MNITGKIYERPWGYYRTIEQKENYQIKHIRVKPRKRLSLQYHHKRDEHWTIIKGTGSAQLDDQTVELGINDTIFIPKKSKHRMANNTDEFVEFIEIQIGDYLGEDDIVRLEDDFGRI